MDGTHEIDIFGKVFSFYIVFVCVCEREWWRGERRRKMSKRDGLQDKNNYYFSCTSLNTYERCKERKKKRKT